MVLGCYTAFSNNQKMVSIILLSIRKELITTQNVKAQAHEVGQVMQSKVDQSINKSINHLFTHVMSMSY